MRTHFTPLNRGWNAEPNAPAPRVVTEGADILLSFFMNPFLYPEFEEEDVGTIRFRNCWRFRLGPTNDEGWWKGQCRFSGLAPAWGEFYLVEGDLLLENCAQPMQQVGHPSKSSNHYLFYLRDETFECDAEAWSLAVISTTGTQRRVTNEA